MSADNNAVLILVSSNSTVILLTCVDEDSIHVDFGTEGAQDKSTGWSEYQHRKQDPCKETEETRGELNARHSAFSAHGHQW